MCLRVRSGKALDDTGLGVEGLGVDAQAGCLHAPTACGDHCAAPGTGVRLRPSGRCPPCLPSIPLELRGNGHSAWTR